VPDVLIPLTAPLPVWWSAASDSGLDHAVADSFAHTLDASPAARAEWLRSPDEWQRRLVPPFLDRVRTRFAVQARPDTALEARLGRILASRAAEVRWGVDARDEFFVRADPVVQTALTYFPRLVGLLAAPSTAR
jgi:hypothetical protein